MTTLQEHQLFRNLSDRLEDKIIDSTEITAATTGTSIATSGIPHSMQGVKSMCLVVGEEGGVVDIPSFTGQITFLEDGNTLETFGYTMPACSAGSTATLEITATETAIAYSDNYHIQYALAYTAAYTITLNMKKRLGEKISSSGSPVIAISGMITATISNLSDIPSSSGSGPGVYRNVHDDFSITVNSGTKTFDISGLDWTLEDIHVDKVEMITSAGVTSNLALTTITVDSARVTLTDITANFTGNENLRVTILGADKNRNQSNDTLKVEEQNPLNEQYITYEVSATEASGTYTHYFPGLGFSRFTLQVEAISTASLTTISASLEDAEATAATTVDVTSALVGSASIAGSDMHFQGDPAEARWWGIAHTQQSGTYTIRMLMYP